MRGPIIYEPGDFHSADERMSMMSSSCYLPPIMWSPEQRQISLPALSTIDLESTPEHSDRSGPCSPRMAFRSRRQDTPPKKRQGARVEKRGLGPRNTAQKAHRAKTDRDNQSGWLQACHDFILIMTPYDKRSTQSRNNGKKSGLTVGKEEIQRLTYGLLEWQAKELRRQAMRDGCEEELDRKIQQVVKNCQAENNDRERPFRLPKSSMLALEDDDSVCECVDNEVSSACATHYALGQTPDNKPDWVHCRFEHRRRAYNINRLKLLDETRPQESQSQRLAILPGRVLC